MDDHGETRVTNIQGELTNNTQILTTNQEAQDKNNGPKTNAIGTTTIQNDQQDSNMEDHDKRQKEEFYN